MATTKTPMPQLEDSFPTEGSAKSFGEFLTTIGVSEYRVAPLVTHTGHVTSWFRLAIPAKHIKRATDLRLAWRAALNLVGKTEASL